MIEITHLNLHSDKNKYTVWLELEKEDLEAIFNLVTGKDPLRVKFPVVEPDIKDMTQHERIEIFNDWRKYSPYDVNDVTCCDIKDTRPPFETRTFCCPPERGEE